MGEEVDAQQRRGHFPVGTLVEVEVKEEDMSGVYFSATVVPPLLSGGGRSRKIKRSKKKKLHVQYRDILGREGGTDRLRELVDASRVRPEPPLLQEEGHFNVNDVVDAFYYDGWWKGVVSRVVGGGEGFVVTFENPPDELEFSPPALREHWDWDDGVWAGPKKHSDLVFEVGAMVEVWFERDEGCWYPAKIVRDWGNAGYYVEFRDKCGRWVKEEVEYAYVRPTPPILKQREFRSSERVDAFFNYGWWSGLITKKVEKMGYDVFFEHMKLSQVLDVSLLRTHMDWKDGQWFIGSSSTSNSEKGREMCVSDSEGGDLKRHKGNEIKHANQETEQIPMERIVIQDEHPMMGVQNVLSDSDIGALKKHKGNDNEHANQESEHITMGRIVVQDEDHIEIDEVQSLVSSVLVDEGSIASDGLQGTEWPFVKCHVGWKVIESMEVLRRMPQKPHFKPLLYFKETEREGMAIGCMVTFSNLVERVHNLTIKERRCMMEDINQTLLDLEKHGFDVGIFHDRVMKLLAVKDKVAKLEHEVKDINDQIMEHRGKRSKLSEEMQVIKGHLRRLREQLELTQIAKADDVRQIAHLQTALDQTQHAIKSSKCSFEGLAASLLFPKLQF